MTLDFFRRLVLRTLILIPNCQSYCFCRTIRVHAPNKERRRHLLGTPATFPGSASHWHTKKKISNLCLSRFEFTLTSIDYTIFPSQSPKDIHGAKNFIEKLPLLPAANGSLDLLATVDCITFQYPRILFHRICEQNASTQESRPLTRSIFVCSELA